MELMTRPYQYRDRSALVNCIDTVCDECRWMATTHFIPDRQWNHALREPDCAFHQLVVSTMGNVVVGWCRLFPEDCVPTCDRGELGIGVLSSYCGQGIGKALLAEVLSRSYRQGFECIDLTVAPGNIAAIRLFRNFDFLPTETMDGLTKMTLTQHPMHALII